MVVLVMVALVAVVMLVGVLQNGQAVTVSFLFWQFEAPLALILFAAVAAGIAIGLLVGGARAVARWRHRAAGPTRDADVVGDSRHPVPR